MRHERPTHSQCKMCKVRIPHSPFARPLLFPLRSAISPGEYKRNPRTYRGTPEPNCAGTTDLRSGNSTSPFFRWSKTPLFPIPCPPRYAAPSSRRSGYGKGFIAFGRVQNFHAPSYFLHCPTKTLPQKKCLPEPPRFDKHFRYITLRSAVLGLSPLLKTTLPYPRRNTTKLRNPTLFFPSCISCISITGN